MITYCTILNKKNVSVTNPGQDWPDPDSTFKKRPDSHPDPTEYGVDGHKYDDYNYDTAHS